MIEGYRGKWEASREKHQQQWGLGLSAEKGSNQGSVAGRIGSSVLESYPRVATVLTLGLILTALSRVYKEISHGYRPSRCLSKSGKTGVKRGALLLASGRNENQPRRRIGYLSLNTYAAGRS